MNQESNNLPPLRSAEDIRMDILRPYLLDPREDYPEPFHMLEFNGVPFSKIGGLAAISGQKKNGKSFVLTQLMAAILGNGCERTRRYLPGLQVPERTISYLGHEPRVLYVDTEMEKLSSAKVLRRVHWLCDWDMRQSNERFNVLWLKNMQKEEKKRAHQQRFDLIRMAIDELQPDVVFVDGLRDLLQSINDEENITTILDYFGGVAEDRNMSIWMALHQNPQRKSDDDDVKMRGWAGTELGNKVSDTLVSIKNKTANGVAFTVKQQDARDKDIDDWKFEIVDDAGNLGIPRIIGNAQVIEENVRGDDASVIRSWVKSSCRFYEWPMSKGDIKKKIFGDIGGQKNHAKQSADMDVAINSGYIVQSIAKKNGAYMWEPSDEIKEEESDPF